MFFDYLLCIINFDDFGFVGVYWVCCDSLVNGDFEYFDFFVQLFLFEWENDF